MGKAPPRAQPRILVECRAQQDVGVQMPLHQGARLALAHHRHAADGGGGVIGFVQDLDAREVAPDLLRRGLDLRPGPDQHGGDQRVILRQKRAAQRLRLFG
jgi:hypothetical protein